MNDLSKMTVGDLFDAVMEGVRYGVVVGLLVGIVCCLFETQETLIATHTLVRDLRNRLPVEPAKESEDAEERS